MTLKDVYEEFREFIKEDNQEFKQFIHKDKFQDSKSRRN